MAYSTINKHTDHFNTKLYTGNGSTNAVTGVGFAPDFTWIKSRSHAANHYLYDKVRGVEEKLSSNTNGAEVDMGTSGLNTFGTDGFTVGNDTDENDNNATYVSWNWKANGAGSANTAGFSIVKYTGNGVSGATVGHGLSTAPKIVNIKKTDAGDSWTMLNTNIDLNKYMAFSSNGSPVSDPCFNNTAPDATKFTIDADGQVNGSGNEFIAYCFAEVPGYSKFGVAKGNGNNNGPFIYTGFAPSMVIWRKTNGSGDWYFSDNKRPGYNDQDKRTYVNTNQAEETYDLINLYSNGFKITNTTHTYSNDNGGDYTYLAFGQTLVGSNNVPCTAK